MSAVTGQNVLTKKEVATDTIWPSCKNLGTLNNKINQNDY